MLKFVTMVPDKSFDVIVPAGIPLLNQNPGIS